MLLHAPSTQVAAAATACRGQKVKTRQERTPTRIDREASDEHGTQRVNINITTTQWEGKRDRQAMSIKTGFKWKREEISHFRRALKLAGNCQETHNKINKAVTNFEHETQNPPDNRMWSR